MPWKSVSSFICTDGSCVGEASSDALLGFLPTGFSLSVTFRGAGGEGDSVGGGDGN